MNEKHIAQLESRLEQLVEGVFAGLFRRHINAHDIAVRLARGMESHLRVAQAEDARAIAPDKYTISLNPDVQKRLVKHRPDIAEILSQHLVELATQSGYRLLRPPEIILNSSIALAPSGVTVKVEHTDTTGNGTAAMQPVQLETKTNPPINPQLIINGERVEPITKAIINIGRNASNDIAINDPFISRHHIQIRLRFGSYTLFDANSKSGTFVNNVAITEHRLQPGDVIRIGDTQLVYMVDDSPDQSAPFATDIFNPVDFK